MIVSKLAGPKDNWFPSQSMLGEKVNIPNLETHSIYIYMYIYVYIYMYIKNISYHGISWAVPSSDIELVDKSRSTRVRRCCVNNCIASSQLVEDRRNWMKMYSLGWHWHSKRFTFTQSPMQFQRWTQGSGAPDPPGGRGCRPFTAAHGKMSRCTGSLCDHRWWGNESMEVHGG